MRFVPVPLSGAYLVEVEPSADERGSFARTYCAREYEAAGLEARVVQCNVSHNVKKGTLRGMHYQAFPNEEAKTVTCVAGAIYDVIVDLREDSPTRYAWFGTELSPGAGRALYIPAGFAHGFLTLTDGATVEYKMSQFYVSGAARGVRYDDPRLGIAWPFEPVVVSERDRGFEPIR